MKTRLFVLMIAILFLVTAPCHVWAEDEELPSFSLDTAFLSKYVWRGYELSDDSLIIQPSATVGYKGFSVNLWGNFDSDFAGDGSNADWNETDYTISYDRSFGLFAMGVGYIYYDLESIDDSEELYLSAGLDTILAPTLTVYREISHAPAWYINFSLSHSFDLSTPLNLPEGITLDLAGSAGYYYSDDDAFSEVNDASEEYRNFHDGVISASLTIPFYEHFTFQPVISYSFALCSKADDQIKAGSFDDRPNYLYGGAVISMAF